MPYISALSVFCALCVRHINTTRMFCFRTQRISADKDVSNTDAARSVPTTETTK